MMPRLQRAETLTLTDTVIVRALVRTAGFFAVAHLAGIVLVAAFGREAIHRASLLLLLDQFNLDEETNLATFFSSALLAFAGVLLILIARRVRETGGPKVLHWRALGAVFLAMSFDEFSGIHERVGSFLRANYHVPGHGALHFTWVLAGLPFVAAVACLAMPFLLSLPPRLRRAMVCAGAVYVSGALGMELLDGWYVDTYGYDLFYALLTIVEELLEIAGAILFIRCLLRHLADDPGEIRVALRSSAAPTKKPTDGALRPWALTTRA